MTHRQRGYRDCITLLSVALLLLTMLALPTDGVQASSKFDFKAHGLPEPKRYTANGIKGYEVLLEQLRDNPDANWAAEFLLRGERTFAANGGIVKRYLTTAWIWFENGSAYWPDPYEINCANSPDRSEVSDYCGYKSIQIAGYQAYTRRNNYVTMFRKFWPDSDLVTILKRTAERSYHASRSKWNYNADAQQKGLVATYLPKIGTATINDISPNKDFFNGRAQFFTLLLGKHPYMAIALNSYAVSDGDLVRALKSSSCAYGYICASGKQRLANMVAALIIYETGSL